MPAICLLGGRGTGGAGGRRPDGHGDGGQQGDDDKGERYGARKDPLERRSGTARVSGSRGATCSIARRASTRVRRFGVLPSRAAEQPHAAGAAGEVQAIDARLPVVGHQPGRQPGHLHGRVRGLPERPSRRWATRRGWRCTASSSWRPCCRGPSSPTRSTGAVGAMVGNEGLIKKVYFPRWVLPDVGDLSFLVGFLVELVVLGGCLAVRRQRGHRVHPRHPPARAARVRLRPRARARARASPTCTSATSSTSSASSSTCGSTPRRSCTRSQRSPRRRSSSASEIPMRRHHRGQPDGGVRRGLPRRRSTTCARRRSAAALILALWAVGLDALRHDGVPAARAAPGGGAVTVGDRGRRTSPSGSGSSTSATAR